MWETIREAIIEMRKHTGRGSININTNGSKPAAVKALVDAGLNSIRVSTNSARRNHFHIPVQRAGEHDERATVVPGDQAEHDRAVEVDDGPADLRAVLELDLAQRLRRAVESGQVRQDDQRSVAATPR